MIYELLYPVRGFFFAFNVFRCITGTVKAKDKVVLEAKANLKGDIITKTLLVEGGAIFNGNSKMGNSGSMSGSVDTSKTSEAYKQ